MANDCVNIHRTPHNDKTPYVCINRDIAQNANLSFAARGMMAYILSKPDDWNITIEDLTANNPAGRDATRNTFNELIDNGYLVAGTQRRIKGRFATATPHQCYETPRTEKPRTVQPKTVNQQASTSNRQPVPENPTEQSKENKVKKQNKKALSLVRDDKPKKQRQPDLIFNAIADIAFNIKDSSKIGSSGGRIGKVKKAVVEAYPNIKPDDLHKFKIWYINKFPDTPLPRVDEKFIEHYIAFNDSFKPALQTTLAPPRQLKIS